MSKSNKLGGTETKMNAKQSRTGPPTDSQTRPPHHPARSVVVPSQQSPPPLHASIMRPPLPPADHPPRVAPKSTKGKEIVNVPNLRNETQEQAAFDNRENEPPAAQQEIEEPTETTNRDTVLQEIQKLLQKVDQLKQSLPPEEQLQLPTSESFVPQASSSSQVALIANSTNNEDKNEMKILAVDFLEPKPDKRQNVLFIAGAAANDIFPVGSHNADSNSASVGPANPVIDDSNLPSQSPIARRTRSRRVEPIEQPPAAPIARRVRAAAAAARVVRAVRPDPNCNDCKLKFEPNDEVQTCVLCPRRYHTNCALGWFNELAHVHANATAAEREAPAYNDIANVQNDANRVCNKCCAVLVGNYFGVSSDGYRGPLISADDIVKNFVYLAEYVKNKCDGKFKILLNPHKSTGPHRDVPNMTWSRILAKARQAIRANQYTSVEEFLSDLDKLFHKRKVIAKCSLPFVEKCDTIMEYAQKAADLMMECPSCYLVYFKDKKDQVPVTLYKGPTEYSGAFLSPCQQAHTLVWFKLPSAMELRDIWSKFKLLEDLTEAELDQIPKMANLYWPGKVFPHRGEYDLAISKDYVNVRIFGPQIKFVVLWSELKTYSESRLDATTRQLTKELHLAIEDANHYFTHIDKQRYENVVPRYSRAFVGLNDLYVNEKEDFRAISNRRGSDAKWKCWAEGCNTDANEKYDNTVTAFCCPDCKVKYNEVQRTPFEEL